MQRPSLKRLKFSLSKRFSRLTKHRYTVEKRMGVFYLIDQANAVDQHLIAKGAWEQPQVDALRRYIARYRVAGCRNVFLDIGAHGGLYSMLMHGDRTFDALIAFEPDPVNAAQLQANLFINHLVGEVTLVQAACTDKAGRVRFFAAAQKNRGMSRIEESTGLQGESMIDVETLTVDSIVPDHGSLIVAKIDVEGFELTALAGMEQVIANNTCLFQIESFAEQFPALNAWMLARGFSLLETVEHDHFYYKA